MTATSNGSRPEPTTMRRPVIGISARVAPVVLAGASLTVSLALQTHVDFLAAAGCLPVLLPLLPGCEHVIGQLDGLLIPGGPDVDPALYGAVPHPRTRLGSPAADAAELTLVSAALAADLPVLAICRGLQLLNVQAGGTLHQHLPEIVGHDGHCPPTDTYTLGEHRLDLAPDSLIAEILPDDDAPATFCHHHQAIDKLGDGLTATGWAPDGVIEVVEVATRRFAIGVQWEIGQTLDTRLHRALAAAAARRLAQS